MRSLFGAAAVMLMLFFNYIEISSGMSREERKGKSVRFAEETYEAFGEKYEEEPVFTSRKDKRGTGISIADALAKLRMEGEVSSPRVTQEKDRRRNRPRSERLMHETDQSLPPEIQTILSKSTPKNKGGRSARSASLLDPPLTPKHSVQPKLKSNEQGYERPFYPESSNLVDGGDRHERRGYKYKTTEEDYELALQLSQLERKKQLRKERAALRTGDPDIFQGVMPTNDVKPRQRISKRNQQPPPYDNINTQFTPGAMQVPYHTNQGQHGVHQEIPLLLPQLHIRTQVAPVEGNDPFRLNQGQEGTYRETPRVLLNAPYPGQYSGYSYYNGPPGPHGPSYQHGYYQ